MADNARRSNRQQSLGVSCPSTFDPGEDNLLAAAHHWQSEGWALVDGLVPGGDVDAVAGDLDRLFAADTFADYNRVPASVTARRRVASSADPVQRYARLPTARVPSFE